MVQLKMSGGQERTKRVAGDFCSICMRSPRPECWRATAAFCCRGGARRNERGAAPCALLDPWQARCGRKAPGPARKASANKTGGGLRERERSGDESGARTTLKDPDELSAPQLHRANPTLNFRSEVAGEWQSSSR